MEEVTKELRNVAQFICLQPVDGIVLHRKRILKRSLPPLVEQAEPPTDQAVVTQKRLFLGAAFHIRGDVHLGEFVCAFLEGGRGHHYC
jgi:hypothetical protein